MLVVAFAAGDRGRGGEFFGQRVRRQTGCFASPATSSAQTSAPEATVSRKSWNGWHCSKIVSSSTIQPVEPGRAASSAAYSE
ncbi:hypothetical protein [Amycolatopsis sp. WQ 127309]|uniref:hypothetical protein n=1 Tax=Amycolatopsis sp. WQ 127309 TaxID=2932773 RepID=UPI002112DD1B|nr:hypothetical protein [Amycolatopsis sp. WQ 127309]